MRPDEMSLAEQLVAGTAVANFRKGKPMSEGYVNGKAASGCDPVTALVVAPAQTEALTQVQNNIELAIHREPGLVLAEAQKAAQALHDVISRKDRPVRFNGEQYLEFEDWQTVARFYGLTAKVRSTTFVEFGAAQGFESSADVINVQTGQVITSAESMCLDDEKNWERKPLFMLRSMAQTRACSKALRNVLSWVVVLAGYRATPAEEMDGVPGFSARGSKEAAKQVADRKIADLKRQQQQPPAPQYISMENRPWKTRGEMKAAFSRLRELVGEVGYAEILGRYGVSDPSQLKSLDQAVGCFNSLVEAIRAEVA